MLRPLVAPAGRISLALSVQVGSSPALGSRRKNTGVNESKFTLSEVPAPGRADHDHDHASDHTTDRYRRPIAQTGPSPRGGLDRTLSISTSAPR